jgi:hypothetical protein
MERFGGRKFTRNPDSDGKRINRPNFSREDPTQDLSRFEFNQPVNLLTRRVLDLTSRLIS